MCCFYRFRQDRCCPSHAYSNFLEANRLRDAQKSFNNVPLLLQDLWRKPSWESGHLACRTRVPVSPTALAYPQTLQRFQASKPAPDASEQVRRRACTPCDMLALSMQMSTKGRYMFKQHEASTHVCIMQATGNYLRGSASSGKGPVTYMVSRLSRVPFMDLIHARPASVLAFCTWVKGSHSCWLYCS